MLAVTVLRPRANAVANEEAGHDMTHIRIQNAVIGDSGPVLTRRKMFGKELQHRLIYGQSFKIALLVIIVPSLGVSCVPVIWGLRLLLFSVDLVSAPCYAGPGGNRP